MYLVGQLSKITNVSIRTLHYYDEIVLLKPSAKTESGYRSYTKDDLIKLQQILALKKLGFTLTQIKEMVQVNKIDSKIERWKQVFNMQLEKIEAEKRKLEKLEQSLYAVKNALILTGEVNTDDILLLIKSIQSKDGGQFLERNFTKEEQEVIMEQLPDLTTENERTQAWITLLKKIHQTVDEPVHSEKSQQLAKELIQFISKYINMDDSLLNKYWGKIKPEDEQTEKVMGLDKKTMDYIEKILDWYEQYGEGRESSDKK